MIGPLGQLVMLITMTHGFRALARRSGPGRSGLLTGLPSTTALVLVGCGLERGVEEASGAAEACLVSLVAASALPLAYARAAAEGWRSAGAAAAAVCGYVAVAAVLWSLPDLGPAGSVALAAVGVAAASRHAKRIGTDVADGPGPVRRLAASRLFVCRTAIPAGYFLIFRQLRALGGAGIAGRFITFPGGSLAVLVTTHLEAGPAAACRMATAMPSGGAGMLAFLAVFRFGCPALGLGWGTAAGFAAALTTLAVVGALTGREGEATTTRPRLASLCQRPHAAHACPPRRGAPTPRRGEGAMRAVGRSRPRHRRGRGFSPWVEALAG